MSFRFTLLYKKSLTDKNHQDATEREIEDAANIQDHYVGQFKEGTSDAEKKKYWEQKSASERVLLEQCSSSLRRRPVSPDRLPGTGNYTEEDKLYSPSLDTKSVKYDHSLIIDKFGPIDQHTLYKTEKDQRERSSSYLRIGLPAFFHRLLEKAQRAMPGVNTPSFHSDLAGRLALMSSLYKAEHPKIYKEVLKGVTSVISSMDPDSKHFRGDLLACLDENFQDQDRAVGFLALIGAVPDMRRQQDPLTGEWVLREAMVRVYDIIYRLSEMRRVFPTHTLRDNCRWFLGTTSEDLQESDSLLTLVDFYKISQHMLILPKEEKQLFSLTAYNSGACVGTIQFYGTKKTLKLYPGESYLGESNFSMDSVDPVAKRGPLTSKSKLGLKPEVIKERKKKVADAKKSLKSSTAHYAVFDENKDRLLAVAKVTPKITPEEKMLLADYFNEELEKVILAKITKNPGFLQAFRKFQADRVSFNERLAQLRDADNAQVAALEAEMQENAMALVRYRGEIDIRADSKEAREEQELRTIMRRLGFTFTRPDSDQTWAVLMKSSALIFGCDDCLGQHSIMRNVCQCLRLWMRQRRAARDENNDPVWKPYSGCADCGFNVFSAAPYCDCMEAGMEALLSEKKIEPCKICNEEKECICPLVIDKDGRCENRVRGNALASEPSSVGLSHHGNPDFLPTCPDITDNYQSAIEGLEDILTEEHQPDTWASSGVLPGHRPADHVRYPSSDKLETLEEYCEPPSLEEDHPARMSRPAVQAMFEAGTSENPVPPPTTDEITLKEAVGRECTVEDFGHGSDLAKLKEKAKNMAKASTPFSGSEKSVIGFAKIPRHCLPYDGRIHGEMGAYYPQHFQGVDNTGKAKRTVSSFALFNSPLASNAKLGLVKPAVVARRYLAKNAQGKFYTPVGTLNKILTDVCGVQSFELSEAAKKISNGDQERPMGKELYKAATGVKYFDEEERIIKVGNATLLQIFSMPMLEPTDIPDTADRAWLYTLSFSDSHGSSAEEFYLQVAGMMAFFSRFWDEIQEEDGQRTLKLALPGRQHASFALSVGGQRGPGRWPMKVAGRICLSIMCGCGLTKPLGSEKTDSSLNEDAYRAYKVEAAEPPPLVRDYSEGSNTDSRMIDPKYVAPSPVGTWRKAKDHEKKTIWYQALWPGLGYEFSQPRENKLGHRVLMTLGDRIGLEKYQCLLGICYYLCTRFEELGERYTAYCAKNRLQRREKAFKSMRFGTGLLDPRWKRHMELLPRFLGKSWASNLETLLFRQQSDLDDMWRPESKDGPLARKFLNKDGDKKTEESEVLGRINRQGQFIRMSEEPTLQATGFSQPAESVLEDFSHFWAMGTADERPEQSQNFTVTTMTRY